MTMHLMHLNVCAGSTAYGFTTPESDVDVRGVQWLGTMENLLGFGSVKDTDDSDKDSDTTFFSFRKFVYLLAYKTSFTQLDLLFTRPEHITAVDSWGQQLLDSRNMFLSKTGILNSCRGFARGQYHFVDRNRPEKRAEREEIKGRHSLTAGNYEKQYRKAQHHSIRTLWQALYCFKTGVWPVYVKDFDQDAHDLLMKMKLEAWPYNEWVELFNSYLASVEQAYVESTLSDNVDKAHFEKIVVNYNLWLIDKLKGNQ